MMRERSANAREQVAVGLRRVLADTYALCLKAHNFHCNVSDQMFRLLPSILEEEFVVLDDAVDEIAERVRSLKRHSPGSLPGWLRSKAGTAVHPAEEMVRKLIADHVTISSTIRAMVPSAQEAGDEATVDLLTQQLAHHERSIRILRSLINKGEVKVARAGHLPREPLAGAVPPGSRQAVHDLARESRP
jgi:starvation-inducible DNA-binding protein